MEKLCSGPNRSSATAVEKSFNVEAGCIISPAFCAKSVSPRVSETIMTPNLPPFTRVVSMLSMSAVRAWDPCGDVHDVRGGPAGRRTAAFRTGFLAARFADAFARPDAACWGGGETANSAAPTTAGDRLAAHSSTTATAIVARARRARKPGMVVVITDGMGNSRSNLDHAM